MIGDGVWRIRRKERASAIEIFKLEETGHGDILTDEFIIWRIKLAVTADHEVEVSSASATTSQDGPGGEVIPESVA